MFFLKRSRQKEADIEQLKKETKAIQRKVVKAAKDTSIEQERLMNLLKANGITLRIYIATGGDKRGH